MVASLSQLPAHALQQPQRSLRRPTLDMAADAPASMASKKASASVSTFNLAKNIVGAGVLSLPNGVAYFSDSPGALIPANILLFLSGTISAYSFSLIGRACAQHKTSNFQDTWAKSVNPSTAKLINGGITLMCFFTVLSYSIIIGDSFTGLARGFNLPHIVASRTNVILFMTTFALFPLCSLENLSSLAPFSLLGLGGVLYTAIYMTMRFLKKDYLPGGTMFSLISPSAQPIFEKRAGSFFSKKTFKLLSMLGTSYIAHFNAPKFYSELENPTISRFNTVVGSAFMIAMFFFSLIMSVGFLTFGGNSMGLILNNYASSDVGASFARLAIGGAILTSYPFAFSALVDGILDLQQVYGKNRSKLVKPYTIGLLTLVTVMALIFKDVGFVNGLSGALFGCLLLMVLPALMNINNIQKKFATDIFGKPLTKGSYGLGNRMPIPFLSKVESMLNCIMIPSGIALTIISVIVSVRGVI